MGRRSRGSGGEAAGDSIDASALLDRFTTVDDKLQETTDALQSVIQTNAAIAEVLGSISGQEVDVPSRNDLPLVADAVIQPNIADGVAEPGDYSGNTETVDLNIPRDGKLSSVVLSFPSGANQSIGIGVLGRDGEALVPYGPRDVKYVALDDKTITFDLDYDVDKGETVTVRFINQRVARSESAISDLTAYANSIVVVTEVA